MEVNVIMRATSMDPEDNGLSVVIHKDEGGPLYLFRYEPRDGWENAMYHECTVISAHHSLYDAGLMMIEWVDVTRKEAIRRAVAKGRPADTMDPLTKST